MQKRSCLLALSLVSLLIFATGQTQEASPTGTADGRQWWTDIEYLASNQIQGRLPGTEGYRQAARFVAASFEKYGLAPAGSDGYFQPVRLTEQKILADQSSAALVLDGKNEPLHLGDEIILRAGLEQPKTVDAPLVFLGYGLHLPEAHYDDFSGQALKGKIAVVISGGPGDIPGEWKASARIDELWPSLQRAGALGLISLPTPKSMDFGWDRMRSLSSQPGMFLSDANLREVQTPMFSATFNPASAEKLFAGSGHTFAELLHLSEAAKPEPRFPLSARLRAVVACSSHQVDSMNVVGKLEGSEPGLKNQFVVISAHLDHLGVGAPANGDPVYHGAMDDASGVASVLEVARLIHESGMRTKRSLLFLTVTGEEKGLLGSYDFARHPTVPHASLTADLNMDMFLPLYPLQQVMVQGAKESTLGADATAVASQMGLQVVGDPEPDRNGYVRTDQYSFVRTGIPAVSLKFGFAAGSKEHDMVKAWRREKYHSPADNLTQPVDKEAAARFNNFVLAMAEHVANDDARTSWSSNSFFRKFDH